MILSHVAGFFLNDFEIFEKFLVRFLDLGHRDFLMIQIPVVVIVLGSFLNFVFVPRFVFKFSGIGAGRRSNFPIFQFMV